MQEIRIFPFSDFSKWVEEKCEEIKTNNIYVMGIEGWIKPTPKVLIRIQSH